MRKCPGRGTFAVQYAAPAILCFMIPAYVVQITTPKNYILNGLWFGPKRPEKVVIFMHGLTGSAFSMRACFAKR